MTAAQPEVSCCWGMLGVTGGTEEQCCRYLLPDGFYTATKTPHPGPSARKLPLEVHHAGKTPFHVVPFPRKLSVNQNCAITADALMFCSPALASNLVSVAVVIITIFLF